MSTAISELVRDFEAVVDDDPILDRHEVFARLREELPVFFSERLDSWVVTRYEDVQRALAEETNFEPPKEGPGAPAFGRSFLQMSGREHNKKVGVVAREMRSPRALRERLDGVVEQIARTRADALPLGETVDMREEYAMWIPLLAITELTAIREASRFRDWYRRIVKGGVSSIRNPADREDAFAARAELREYLRPIIEERREHPGRDLVSDLVQATYEGEPWTDEEIAATVVFLLAAGVETTERVLTSALRYLALHPAEWEALYAHRDDHDYLSAFSAEALRMFPPVNGTVRIAQNDVELGGERVAAGDKIVVLLVAANRDPERFPDPNRFDVSRFADHPDRQFTSAGDILPFGAGPHHCTGSRLAQTEMLHAFMRLMERVRRIEPAGDLPPGEGFMLHSPPSLPLVLYPS